MKKATVWIILLAMVFLLAGAVLAEDAGYTGTWYLCTYRNSECMKAEELCLNDDKTVTYISEPSATGSWEIQGKELTIITVNNGSESKAVFTFDLQSQAFWAEDGAICYGIMRIAPEEIREAVSTESTALREFEGVWIPEQVFNAENELPMASFAMANMKMSILEATLRNVSTGEKANVTVPYVSLYEENTKNPITEYVKADFLNGTIFYKVLDMESGSYDVKYSGEIVIREEGDLLMTVDYAGKNEQVMVIWAREPVPEGEK